MEERIARLWHDLEVEPVAEVRRVLGEDAVAKEAEDRRVLALQLELELGLEFVELVEMSSWIPDSSSRGELRHRSAPGHDEIRIELGERLERERVARAAGDAGRAAPAPRRRDRRRAGGRGRSCAGRTAGRLVSGRAARSTVEQRCEELGRCQIGRLDLDGRVEEASAGRRGRPGRSPGTQRRPPRPRKPSGRAARSRVAASPPARRGSRRARRTPAPRVRP